LISFLRKIRICCEEKDDSQQIWNVCAEADGKLVRYVIFLTTTTTTAVAAGRTSNIKSQTIILPQLTN